MTAADRAADLGRHAGETCRETGMPRRCPFPNTPTMKPLRDAWTRAYVEAAYARH
ncbi:MAG TPA: hypothetical protein VFL65_00815 [Jatrophihabitans sp.]|nr:hypothetical protein [Jatrophihabitans sp.]